MGKFRKKPVVIDAFIWKSIGVYIGEDAMQLADEANIISYQKKHGYKGRKSCPQCNKLLNGHGLCPTLEGEHIVCPDDYIIKGVKGEFYPCKPDIFKMTYDKI